MVKPTESNIANSKSIMAMQIAKDSILIVNEQFWKVQDIKLGKNGTVVVELHNGSESYEIMPHVSELFLRFS